MSVTEFGLLYQEVEWPHGLMCAECPRMFREGERYTMDLYAFSGDVPIVQIVCLECAAWRSESPRSF
jgi:hypothetical protein